MKDMQFNGDRREAGFEHPGNPNTPLGTFEWQKNSNVSCGSQGRRVRHEHNTFCRGEADLQVFSSPTDNLFLGNILRRLDPDDF